MAVGTTPEPSTAEQHRVAQAALVAAVARMVSHAFGTLLDPHDLTGTTPRLAAAVDAIVKQYGRAAASAALTFYRNERRAAGITGRPRLLMPEPTPLEQVTKGVEWAVSDLYGPVSAEKLKAAEDAVAGVTEQFVLDEGRHAIIGATQQDPKAKGWARVTDPGACSFCALLATRGAVYKSEQTADFRAHTKQPNGSGGVCRCHAEPVFNAYEPSHQVRQWQADYKRLTETYGKSGRDLLIAWRQHIEGRPVTGPPTKPYTRA